MARVVKKVKTNKFKFSKRFYIILTSVLVVLIATAITLSVIFYYKNNAEDDTTDFTDYPEYKMNYADADDLINGPTMHIFIFVYDGSTFDIEENTTTDKVTYDLVVKLIKAVNNKNKEMEDEGRNDIITFKLIDTSLKGNANTLTDSKLGALNGTSGLIYIYNGTYSSVTKNVTDDEVTISGSGGKINTYIQEAIVYIQKLTE